MGVIVTPVPASAVRKQQWRLTDCIFRDSLALPTNAPFTAVSKTLETMKVLNIQALIIRKVRSSNAREKSQKELRFPERLFLFYVEKHEKFRSEVEGTHTVVEIP